MDGAVAVRGDITKAGDLARAIAEAKLGAIDIAVNNAGGSRSSIEDMFRPFRRGCRR
jgi:3-oxoacyl-[acyl-carrier protein] reductase